MESTAKKCLKKTSMLQFELLLKELEKNPDIAKGTPVFGSSKTQFDKKWEGVVSKLNANGPPRRNTAEWKKVWSDLKGRTKKKIAENKASLRATGGGMYVEVPLSELELAVDRIIQISSAVSPQGKTFGVREFPLPQSSTTTGNESPSLSEFAPTVSPPVHTSLILEENPEPQPSSSGLQVPQNIKKRKAESQSAKFFRKQIENQAKYIKYAENMAKTIEKLSECAEKQENFSARLLELMEKQTIAMERQAEALEKMAERA